MPVIGQKHTLKDVASRLDPNGKVDKIVEILNRYNVVTNRLAMKEGNLSIGHQTTIRSGLPTVTWRKLNYGVQPSKSTTVKIIDSCGMLEGYSKIDKDVAMLNGNTSAYRLSEDVAFLESMAQTFEEDFIYSNSNIQNEKFLGLAPRYGSLSAENAKNIINAKGTTANKLASIWLLTFGEESLFGIYPKGSKAGIQHKDLGEVTIIDPNGGEYQGLKSHYQWKVGVCLKDWRRNVRIANIDVTKLTSDASTGANLIELMVKATNLLRSRKGGSPVFYVSETIMDYLDLQIMNKKNLYLTYETVDGKPITRFRGVPIELCEGLKETEKKVV
jgi:hypothetical protein